MAVALQPRPGLVQVRDGDPELLGALVEMESGGGIFRRIAVEGEIVSKISARAVETGALGSDGDSVW